jgi:hypothetical protein
MTISSTVSERSWPGNGSAKQFDFDGIDCNDDGDFRLWITDDTTLVQTEVTTNYSISLNADQQNDPGGTLTYPVSGEAVPEGETLTLERSSPFTQETDLQEGNAFEPEVIEEILDQAARERQELLAKLNRAAIIPRGSAYTVDEIVSLIASAVSSSQNFFDTYQDALNEIADLVLAGEVSIQELLLQATIAANHLEEILLPAGYDTIGEYIQNVVNMLTLQAGAQYYNPDTVYNPTGRTAPSFVYGSDGVTYVCVGENVQGDDPVGSVTGNWVKVLQEVIDAAAQALAAAQAAQAAADAAQDAADAAQDAADAALARASIGAMPPGIEIIGGITGFECTPALDEDHDVTISPGACLNSTGELAIKRAASMVKRLYGYWIEGDSQNGLLNGQVSPVTSNTLYHLYALLKNDGSVDFGWLDDGENIGNHLPTNYVGWRWLRYHLVDVNANIIRTTQNGDFIQHHKGSDWIVAVDVPTTPTAYDHSAFLPINRVKSIKYGSRVSAGSSSASIFAVDEDSNVLFTTSTYAPVSDTSTSSWSYTRNSPMVPFYNDRLFRASSDPYNYSLLIHLLELKR